MNKNSNIISKTIFCDIDGTLLEHRGDIYTQINSEDLKVLPGVLKKLKEWEELSYKIILTTGRRESLRKLTEIQLQKAGITYDLLIMGIGPGVRYLINDKKINSEENTAFAINITRNSGLEDVNI